MAPRPTPFTSDIPSALLDPNWQPRFGFTYSICLITWLETPLCQHRPPPASWQSWCLIRPVLTSRCGFPSLLAQGLCQQYSDCDSRSGEDVLLQRDQISPRSVPGDAHRAAESCQQLLLYHITPQCLSQTHTRPSTPLPFCRPQSRVRPPALGKEGRGS